MAMPTFTMRELLEAGIHFGHHTRRWNPKMKPFIFGERNNIHIIDLQQTVPMLYQALNVVRDITAKGGRVLFVGTKRQAQDKVKEAAERCGQFYVNHRWLGGMLTNWKTITKSIQRFNELEKQLSGDIKGLTKLEILELERERDKFELAIGGIREMGGQPDAIIVIDTLKEKLAIAEANKLGIPVIAVIDTNSDPEGITFPIPGNDDALRAIEMYCHLFTGAVLDGLQAELGAKGVDIGAASQVAPENATTETDTDKKAKAPRGSNKKTETEAAKPTVQVVKTKTVRTAKKADDAATDMSADDVAAMPKVAAAQ
jgi:small subunit ribosomal protein S2